MWCPNILAFWGGKKILHPPKKLFQATLVPPPFPSTWLLYYVTKCLDVYRSHCTCYSVYLFFVSISNSLCLLSGVNRWPTVCRNHYHASHVKTIHWSLDETSMWFLRERPSLSQIHHQTHKTNRQSLVGRAKDIKDFHSSPLYHSSIVMCVCVRVCSA